MPKFLVVLMMAQARAALAPVGAELAQAGRLEQLATCFFLNRTETRAALGGADQRALVDERRAEYALELRRRHLPRFLLSDGTEAALHDAASEADGDVLRGTPASAGQVVGCARVLLEPTGARLRPGDILVAPSTDPGWTPLFITASGLVMQMCGAMSHGAVVAREYGIPAVVGLAGATERIADGQMIAVNGTTGHRHAEISRSRDVLARLRTPARAPAGQAGAKGVCIFEHRDWLAPEVRNRGQSGHPRASA